MARKFWTLQPIPYFTHKQLPKGGRNQIWFAAAGCIAYYFMYTNFHRKVKPTPERTLVIDGKSWL